MKSLFEKLVIALQVDSQAPFCRHSIIWFYRRYIYMIIFWPHSITHHQIFLWASNRILGNLFSFSYRQWWYSNDGQLPVVWAMVTFAHHKCMQKESIIQAVADIPMVAQVSSIYKKKTEDLFSCNIEINLRNFLCLAIHQPMLLVI